MRKLERSLKRAAKGFGESSQQAVVRWGVQTARELAVATQVYGIGGARKKQANAIEAGMNAVLFIMPARSFNRRRRSGDKRPMLDSPEAINKWVESQRGKRGRTNPLPISEKGICKPADFRKALRMRVQKAGAAKGPWIGAGQSIAKAQRGSQQIRIGKNFLSYAQKHARLGKSTRPQLGFRPSASLTNTVGHVASSYVLKNNAIDRALAFGARKTATWYRRATKAKLDKA